MKLYHGSNVAVLTPRLMASGRNLDFGKGFYLTSSLEQAERWADITTRRRKTGQPTVTCYLLQDDFPSILKVRRFRSPSKAWLNYVAQHRRGNAIDDGYDVVIGPVANDQTMPTLILFLDGFITADMAIRTLLPQKLKDQYACKTAAALSLLDTLWTRPL